MPDLSLSASYSQVLSGLSHAPLSAIQFNRGIEKEGLRVLDDSQISQQDHPLPLGSTLTHPHITTDYSEALLEFITPVKQDAKQVLDFLHQAHSYSYQHLNGEFIWPASMPGVINDELDVPIAHYGSSNVGRLKHVYRHGLWHRYGRKMQCIAGLHYNFSVNPSLWEFLAQQNNQTLDQDFINDGYFGLIRNFRRYSWLLLYLFGASPAVDKSFLQGKDHSLQNWDASTAYGPHATSLRMSGLGYQNNAQESLFVCFNGLPSYTKTLQDAMAQQVPAYEAIGLKDGEQYKQLNANLLQIENEYYSDIRPKRNAQSGEKPLTALNRHGVEYIEVRCLDLNPFEPLGISEQQIHFMDLFLAYCLLQDSPYLAEQECREVAENQKAVVQRGREPGFILKRLGRDIALKEWGQELLQAMMPLAKLLDDRREQQNYVPALQLMMDRIEQPESTPSAQILAAMRQQGLSFSQLALAQARETAQYFSAGLSPEQASYWSAAARESLAQTQQLEADDDQDFAQYLNEFLNKV